MKIHFLSNSLRMNSGLGNVTKYLALGLKNLGYDVTMTGIQVAYTSDYSYGIEQIPLNTMYVDETTQLMMNLQKVNPDVMIYVGQMDANLNHVTKVFDRQICYVPVEGRNMPDYMINDLISVIKRGGIVMAQCKYGRDQMNWAGINCGMIYHGYNDEIFKKLNEKEMKEPYCYYCTSVGLNASDPRLMCYQGCFGCIDNKDRSQCQYFKEETVSILRMINIDGDGTGGKKWEERDIEITKLPDETKGKFVYGFVGINFGIRKQINRLLRAYWMLINESKQMKDRTMLHLHCMPIAINGANLMKKITQLGIGENIIFSYGSTRSNAWSEEAICRLYNTFNVHVSASSAEGFGMTHLESLACGVPNIAPDTSSMTELITDDQFESMNRGWLANISTYHEIPDGSERDLVDVRDLMLKMKMAYVEKEKMETFSENGMKWAKQYNWDRIVSIWDELLKSYPYKIGK